MKNIKLGIIGCGNMSQAILNGLFSAKGTQLLNDNGYTLSAMVSDVTNENFKAISNLNVKTTLSNEQLVNENEYILFAVKPQSFSEIVKSLNLKSKTILSIMAGVNLSSLSNYSDCVARIMPNLNAKVLQSVNAFTLKGLNEEQSKFVLTFLKTFGEPFQTDESQMNAITGACGSGPAFAFKFINAYIKQLELAGFTHEQSKQMAVAVIIGSANNVLNEKTKSVDEMVTAVCSKGGTTIEGVNHLNDNSFENIVETAILKAIQRSGELEKQR